MFKTFLQTTFLLYGKLNLKFILDLVFYRETEVSMGQQWQKISTETNRHRIVKVIDKVFDGSETITVSVKAYTIKSIELIVMLITQTLKVL